MNDLPMKWSLYKVWNDSILLVPERQLVPRDYMWASELGGPMADRYLKMKGVKPSNPASTRALRKFDAGNIWEWIVGIILKRAGILTEEQVWLPHQYPGMLKVTGKLDFLAGGNPDWEKSKAEISKLDLPPFITIKANAIIDMFSKKYPSGLEQIVLEIKSSSVFLFDKLEKTGQADPKHRLQAFHYLISKDMPEAHVVYICKDDARLLEVGIYNPSPVEDEYKKDIEEMSFYFNAGQQPPKEREVVFSKETQHFAKNWKVGYSPYLTYLYGYETTADFDETHDKKVQQWNRVLARCVNGNTLTKANKDIITDIKKEFPSFDDYVEIIKKQGVKFDLEGGEI